MQLRGLGSAVAGFSSARDAELKPGLGSAVAGFSSSCVTPANNTWMHGRRRAEEGRRREAAERSHSFQPAVSDQRFRQGCVARLLVYETLSC